MLFFRGGSSDFTSNSGEVEKGIVIGSLHSRLMDSIDLLVHLLRSFRISISSFFDSLADSGTLRFSTLFKIVSAQTSRSDSSMAFDAAVAFMLTVRGKANYNKHSAASIYILSVLHSYVI